MNPLEIYRLLPRTNCGECVPKTCMSFAVSLPGNPDSLEQCKDIKPENIEGIRSLLVQSDWRDELVKSLADEVSKMNLRETASDLGCPLEGGDLVVRCIGQEYRIRGNGDIIPDTRNAWIKILLFHYVRNRGKGEFDGRWVSFSELKNGFVKASTFSRECEEPLRQILDGDLAGTVSLLERLGASRAAGFSADYSWTMDLLPKIRTLILYRPADEEFPSSLKILFDGIADRFLDVESLVFIGEGLVHTIMKMGRS
jgi:hypothetical protein